ncbi:MAG TPA: winged helix-turn-helix domain-containing protein [Candidatus Janibacter merdipullorum]|nr:winged helix-turn-helix domain-containing protein [Candidatus Janibacter merdipullorum]
MSIHILVDSEVLSRSRFALSLAVEVMGTLRRRRHRGEIVPGATEHTVRWNRRAAERLDERTLHLLHALVPVDHDYTPDFLTPRPTGTRLTIEEVTERIATTPEEIVDYHLDIGLDGRPVRPEVVEQFASEEHYRRWRRPLPRDLAPLIAAGPRALAEEAARAIELFHRRAIADDWPLVRSVLETDIAQRGTRISTQGWAAMLADLGDLTWTGSELTIERPYEGVVDWADDGVLFVPSTALAGRVQFCAERPDSPVLTYPAQGVAALWSGAGDRDGGTDIADLIGRGRREVLELLDRPRTTRDLSRLDGRAESTISYHLGVLARAGLVTKQRTGGSVGYRRTALGDSLVAGDLPRGHSFEQSA